MTKTVLRIGIFTDTFTPDINGVVTVIQMMTRELTSRGHEVIIFCPKHRGDHTDHDGVCRFPSVRFVFYKGLRMAIPFSRKAFRQFPTLDIIHSHDPGPMGWLAHRAARRFGIAHIHTYHDLYVDYRRYLPRLVRPSRNLVKRLSRYLGDRCDAVIAPSEQMRIELSSYGITRPIYALPFGVDARDFEHTIDWNARQELNLPTEDLLLYAGRVGMEKNLDFLLRVFKRIHNEKPSVRLVIAGDGPHRKALEQYAATLGVDAITVFTGFLNRRDLIDFYKQATLFVFPSTTDTQGLVIMEAMMAGAAVVSVNVLGPVDVIRNGETGILVNPVEEEFANACLGLLGDDRARATMGAAATRWARSNTSRVSTGRLLEIYGRHQKVNEY